uniref:Uncharacterized protein n=1 Tax=Chromera velia CCMP2878 TaxID=1169474 RepID=A0A0G4H0J6_9ALVE|eukprot:Cvel_24221.t1-p1 / transcript=Cvel_24221.t1 / gene=Cvel_24221 / organism=Chromera_velia_CCMP2878 / gene_product=Long-chain-fatty-acid--AMP ligase FadD28, putative / transcript_product=Long-chain-fatty-acid--AMP ligase FadD28, putative / location=Cvel_scaffold2589:25880-26506(-) / protein_length=163 / sequence_SO=supercontig / SO=protein_coding / is_pseudo=false
MPENKTGEVWVLSASCTRGYFNLPDKTKETFYGQCTLAKGRPSENLYLRTGDSGFIHKGELFIAGRIKDMLIVRGRNYFPQLFQFRPLIARLWEGDPLSSLHAFISLTCFDCSFCVFTKIAQFQQLPLVSQSSHPSDLSLQGMPFRTRRGRAWRGPLPRREGR